MKSPLLLFSKRGSGDFFVYQRHAHIRALVTGKFDAMGARA
jgi:hypothetical protein